VKNQNFLIEFHKTHNLHFSHAFYENMLYLIDINIIFIILALISSAPIGFFSDKGLAFCAMQEHFVAVRYRWISDIRSPSWAFPP
jgi:hypothetical protein